MGNKITIQTRVAKRVIDLTDVDTTGLANGDVLKYSTANNNFYVEERARVSGGSF